VGANGEQTGRHLVFFDEVGALDDELRDAFVDRHEDRGHPETPDQDVFPCRGRVGTPERSASRPVSSPERSPRLFTRLGEGEEWAIELAELAVEPVQAVVPLREPEVAGVLDDVAYRGNQHADERDYFDAGHCSSQRLDRCIGAE
jgi:hypothetical protein